MGFLNKLMFWKKNDEFDFDGAAQEFEKKAPKDQFGFNQADPFGEEKSPFTESTAPLGRELPPSAQQTATRQMMGSPTGGMDRDLELISSKLDTLKAMLTSLEQRMANLERAAGVEQKRNLW